VRIAFQFHYLRFTYFCVTFHLHTTDYTKTFSTGGRVLSCYRSSLTPKIVEALVCTQNWCRSSPLTMEDEEIEDEFYNLEQGILFLF